MIQLIVAVYVSRSKADSPICLDFFCRRRRVLKVTQPNLLHPPPPLLPLSFPSPSLHLPSTSTPDVRCAASEGVLWFFTSPQYSIAFVLNNAAIFKSIETVFVRIMLVVLVLAVAVAGSPLPQQEPPKFSSSSLGDDGISRSLGDHASRGVSDSIALKEPEEGVDHLKPADAEQTYSQPDLSTLLSITETPKLISPSTVTSSVENIDKLENMQNMDLTTFEPTLPAATTPSRGLLDLTTGSSSTEASTGVVKTTSISIQHDKPFKREAVDKPSTNLRFSDSSSYSDYEKEDSNLFSFDPSSRDPRIYIDYSDIEAEKAKHKKDSAKILSSTQPPVMDDKKINKAVLLESKQLKKQNETGTYETVVFSDELGKSLEPNIPFVRTLTDSSSVNLEESPPVNSVNSKENMDFTKVEEDEDVIAGSENLARSHIASVMNGSVKRDNSSQMATVKLEKNMESVDVSLPSSPPHVSEKTRDTFLEEESSVREGFRDETLSEKIISSGNEDLEVESTDASVTDDTISQSREIDEKNNILDPIETKPVTDREHDPVKDRNDSSEQGSPSTEDPRLEGSHPKVASEEEDSYAVSPPSAAAVAEAAVLTHFPVDRSKESRALDSRLTADKHVHSFVAPSVAPHEEDDAQTARGVSAARAASDVNMGYITAIVCGVLLTMLLIIGLGLFIHSQRRNLNRPKALSCDRGYAGSDSGGYLDDQCQSSYTNSHLDIPKPATSPAVRSSLTQSQSLTSSCGSAVFTLSAFPSGASVDLGDSAVTDSPAITHCRASIDQSHKSIRKPFVVYAPTTEFFSPTKDSNWVVVRRVARSASRFRRVFKEVHFKPNALPLRNLCRRAPALVSDSTHVEGCSDDVISLDNDSFLNSLESMTIQNLWTDNIKHTKL
ncbi:hypothetical protein FHG87_019264 [Trinorchestia longiramus]|nr:hypothetical protein FHG87_019264 [Trinorchestia longiramus]